MSQSFFNPMNFMIPASNHSRLQFQQNLLAVLGLSDETALPSIEQIAGYFLMRIQFIHSIRRGYVDSDIISISFIEVMSFFGMATYSDEWKQKVAQLFHEFFMRYPVSILSLSFAFHAIVFRMNNKTMRHDIPFVTIRQNNLLAAKGLKLQ